MKTLYKNISGCVTADTAAEAELELINRHTIKPLTADEVFCFTLTLCDNEIDRDCERFSVASLVKLATLFDGRTGITDHDMKSDSQTARIYSTWIEESEDELASTGEKYTCLKARAYMPRTPKNEEVIKQIEAGIKKETSVSCSVGAMRCSVCGADLRKKSCKHRKGEVYDGKVCHTVLEEPTDAYEWSFVAVPAQPRAGVTKSFEAGEGMSIAQIKEKSGGYDSVTLSVSVFDRLTDEIGRLEKLAKDAEMYRKGLEKQVVRLGTMAVPSLGTQEFEEICSALTSEQLSVLEKAFAESASKLYPVKPQLGGTVTKKENNNEFKI